MTLFRHPLNKRSARDGGSSGRMTDKEIESMPAEPTLEELIAARERLDGGFRLAFPQLFDAAPLASEPPPSLDPAIAALLAKDIAPMREQMLQDMVILDANREQSGAGELHLLAATVCATLDEMAAVLRREVGS